MALQSSKFIRFLLFTPLYMHFSATPVAVSTTYNWGSILEVLPGFDTIDGSHVSQEEGETALRKGMAVLVGGLLVGLVACYE